MSRYLTTLAGPDNQSTLNDMALVEAVNLFGNLDPDVGQAWLKDQVGRPTGYNAASALTELRKGHLNDCCGAVIYGSGGWNRWCLMCDGRVRFSAYHSMRHSIQAARDLGFDVD
jgi:hypothetical protein